jgi:hypothetical protein
MGDSAPVSAQQNRTLQRDVKPARTRVLKTWNDTVMLDDREVERRVTIVFDYNEGVAWEYAYDSSGKQISARRITANPPRPSQEEFDDAVAILKADPQIGRVMARTNARPEGGFLLEEEKGPCGPRTRCIQILLMAENSMGLLRRSVVDLVKGRIVYASFVPGEWKAGKQ